MNDFRRLRALGFEIDCRVRLQRKPTTHPATGHVDPIFEGVLRSNINKGHIVTVTAGTRDPYNTSPIETVEIVADDEVILRSPLSTYRIVRVKNEN